MIFKKIHLFSLSKKIKKPKKIDLMIKNHKGLMTQIMSKKLKNTIHLRYKKEVSNSSPMEKSNHRNRHANIFLTKLTKELKNKIKNKKVLEIGCGSGHLLRSLKIKGANVSGIEPGIKMNRSEKIPIVNDFSGLKNNEKFDVIISNAVLEHIFNLKIFFKNIKKFLKKDGIIFFCVPDCEKSIKIGDPTILNHEHVYYFTKESILNTFKKYNFISKAYNDSKGNLFCLAKLNLSKKVFNSNKTHKKNISSNYKKRFDQILKKFEIWFNKNKNYEIILYGATSAITTIFSYINIKKKFFKLNVVDGDISKQSKYISGLNKKILKPDYLKKINKKRVKIFIFAVYYENEIKKILRQKYKIKQKDIFTLTTF